MGISLSDLDRTAPRADNVRNWLPILGCYAYIAIVVLASLWFFRWREGQLPWLTDIPVALFAIALIGPAQHRLLLLGQDAALGCLFRNRWLNELVGDWLIHFPFSTATQQVRPQVVSHYTFPNDPKRDAELVIAERAGFWPLKAGRLLRLSSIIRWQSLRANYNFEPNPDNPNFDSARPPSKVAVHLGTAYVLGMFAFLIGLAIWPNEDLLTIVPPVMWLVAMATFALLPQSKYYRGLLSAPYSPKAMTLMRITFITLVNCGLGWSSYLTGRSAVLNYIALWIAPMFTTTAALMILRHWRQHGAPGGTKDTQSGWLVRAILFPLNQHLHSAKHRIPSTPWYRLKDLTRSER